MLEKAGGTLAEAITLRNSSGGVDDPFDQRTTQAFTSWQSCSNTYLLENLHDPRHNGPEYSARSTRHGIRNLLVYIIFFRPWSQNKSGQSPSQAKYKNAQCG